MSFEQLPLNIQEIIVQDKYSPSEKHGLSLLTDQDLIVFSPGISTGGVAEIKMALAYPNRKIIATSIDEKGITDVGQTVKTAGLDGQIEVKVEDVSKPNSYPDNYFDFIYARLLLHYLPKDRLRLALEGLNRVLKPKTGRMFVVVRSTDDSDIKISGSVYDPTTCLTSYPFINERGEVETDKVIRRYFHTQDSITRHLKETGFKIDEVTQHDEKLYLDFSRTKLSSQMANVIDVVAKKS